MPNESQPPDQWESVAPFCAAAGLGTLGAMLGALRQINPELRIQFGALSALCGAGAAAAGWLLGRGLWRLSRTKGADAAVPALRRRVITGLALLGGITVLAFAVAVAGLPGGRRNESIAGVFLALLVIGAVGWAIWRIARFLGRPDDGDPESG